MRSVIATSLAVLALIALAGCERWELDRRMEELCKKDSGIKVYETVRLPSLYFNSHGGLKVGPSMPWGVRTSNSRSNFQRIGDDEYRYIVTRVVVAGRLDADLERGEGLVQRIHEAVFRRSDDKLLGEYVRYVRAGGDGFTFGFHPSSKRCPNSNVSLVNSIFMMGE